MKAGWIVPMTIKGFERRKMAVIKRDDTERGEKDIGNTLIRESDVRKIPLPNLI